jgi:hypothetical protein
MGYMQEVDGWLEGLLQDFVIEETTFDNLKRAIREKILESYRNGQKAEGQSHAPQAKVRSAQKNAGKPQRYTGNWQCSVCGKAITSLPFEPKKGTGVKRLQCLDCYNGRK